MVISAAQAVDLFRTQPLNFMEAQKSDGSASNPFMAQTFGADYNPNHPDVRSPYLANRLDINA